MISPGLQPLALGFFQFDNLIRNKIPFLLLTTNVDLEAHFGALERQHLQSYSVVLEDFSLASVEQVLREKQTGKEHPIVMLCENGKKSEKLAKALSGQNYMNVYFFAGGFLAFKAEATLA